MEKSIFFNSTAEVLREYNADDFAAMFKRHYRNGVYKEDEKLTLRPTNTGLDMNTSIAIGSAMIQGHMYINESPLTLTHEMAHATEDRIDRVVLRLDLNDNRKDIRAYLVKGVASLSPVAPVLTRDELIYEVSLAQVLIKAGKSSIATISISDERLDKALCGVLENDMSDYDMEATRSDGDGRIIEVSYTLNGILVEKTELSNKDVTGHYLTLKIHKYLEDGLTIGHTKEYKLTYNVSGQVVKRELI